jgi:Glycosyl transferase family 2.
MNKGIQAATGDYLLFMNADDIFYTPDIISKTVDAIKSSDFPDAIYGDVIEETEYGIFRKQTKDIKEMSVHMAISHQTIFIKTSLLKERPFDTQYKYAADFEMLSYFYNNGYRFVYSGLVVAVMVIMAGTTYNNYIASVNEHYSLLLKRGIDLTKERDKLLFKKKLVRIVKSCLPNFIKKPLFKFIAKHYKAL